MINFTLSRIGAAGFMLLSISLLMALTGASFERAAIFYILIWVAVFDGRIIQAFMIKEESTSEQNNG